MMKELDKILSLISNYRRQLLVLGSLVFSSALCVGLLVLRAWHYGQSEHHWMVGNLFLAWLPAFGAFTAYNLDRLPTKLRWWPIIAVSIFWLLFLPNAAYLITDLVHLEKFPGVPLWYDLLTLVSFAFTGTFLGMVSLSMMQELVRRTAGTAVSWVFAGVVMVLSGFGIYFGRVLRWNSWDVWTKPMTLLSQLWELILNPFAHPQTLAFAGLYTLLLSAIYFMAMAFTQLDHEHRRQ